MAALVRGVGSFARKTIVFRKIAQRAAFSTIINQCAAAQPQLCGRTASLLAPKSGPNNPQMRLFQSKEDPPKQTKEDIEKRVLKVCAAFDKLPADKLKVDSHFINDLGLDSLDHVEIIMAMEDEFGFEIPDTDSDRLLRPNDIVRYVADREDVHE